ncbi:hypothetical protein Tco_0526395 [Tanacetum coccineum]
MPSASLQNTPSGSIPKPRSMNQMTRNWPTSKSSCVTSNVVQIADHSRNSIPFSNSKYFVCSTYHTRVFNVNHDACITKFLHEVNPRAKIQLNKTTNRNKPVEQKSHTQKPESHSTLARARLTANPHMVPIQISLTLMNANRLMIQAQPRTTTSTKVPIAYMIVMTSMTELESLFGPSFDEYFNGENQVVSKSSIVTTADASDKRQQQPDSTSSTSTLAKTVTADGNFDFYISLFFSLF